MRAVPFLLLLLATTVAAAPVARKPVPTWEPAPASSTLEQEQVTTPGCSIGITGPAVWVVDYLQPPDDAYYLRVRPKTCAPCASAPGVWISSVKLTLEFRVPCSQPVQVGVVSALADTVCALPDPPRTMRGPVNAMLTAASPGIHTFTVPLDGSVALLKDSWLRVMFPSAGAGCSDDATRPRLVTTSACSVCVTWNFYPSDTTDLCALIFPGTPLISAVVDACVAPSLADVGDLSDIGAGIHVQPNPSFAGTRIRFALAERGRVRVEIRDVAGRLIRQLVDGERPPAEHEVAWDGRDDRGAAVRPGAYFALLRAGPRMISRCVVLLGAPR